MDFAPTFYALVHNHTLEVAERCEKELGEEEEVFLVDGCPRHWESLPPPGGPITAGIDGGYVRDWENKVRSGRRPSEMPWLRLVKSLIQLDAEIGSDIQKALASTKWNL